MTKYEEKTIKDCEYIVLSIYQPDYNPKCPYCKSMPRVHERSNKAIRDLDVFGKKVILDVEYRKFQCLSCGKYFSEPFESIDPRSRMTKRLRDKLSYESFDYSFAKLERRYGFSDTTIKTAFTYWQKEMDELRSDHLYASAVIGIDETKICGAMRGVVVDIENNKVLELLEDKKIDSFTSFFNQLKNIDTVKVVNIDMFSGYKSMAYDYFGKDIVIVVDKYHVVARVVKAMLKGYYTLVGEIEDKSNYSDIDDRMSIIRRDYETLNKDDRKTLTKLLKAIPGLKHVYGLKESFRAIYKNKNRKNAEEALDNWMEAIGEDAELKDYRTARKTIKSWKREILNYFDYQYTNAFTEGFNNLMKRTNRIGNGYSFKVLRGKMLYGSSKTSFLPAKKEKIKKSKNMLTYDYVSEPDFSYDADEHFGVDIDELFKELSNWIVPED